MIKSGYSTMDKLKSTLVMNNELEEQKKIIYRIIKMFYKFSERKEEFKAAALASKHSGDKSMALEYLKVAKQFDLVMDAYKAGEKMDLNELPTVEAVISMLRHQTTEEQKQSEGNFFYFYCLDTFIPL